MRSREPLSHSSANSLAICAAATVAHGLVSLDTLEFLSGNIANLRMRKLQLIPEHTPISLALPLELRSSSAFRHVFRGQLTFRRALRTALTAQQGRVARRLEAMADRLDLRAMASFSADAYTTAGKPTYACLRGWPCP
jgi:hypothetical protein